MTGAGPDGGRRRGRAAGTDGGATPRGAPSRGAVLAYLRDHRGPVTKRDLAKAFAVSGEAARIELKSLLRELEAEGLLERGPARRLAAPGGSGLPPVSLVQVHALDADGLPLARPVRWTDDAPMPVIAMDPSVRGGPALAIGDRVLARIDPDGPGRYTGRTIKRLEGGSGRVVGTFELDGRGQGRIRVADRKAKDTLAVSPDRALGARHGDLVVAELLPAVKLGPKRVEVVEILGRQDDPRAFSLIAIHARDLPTSFSPEALAEAERATVPPLGTRTDLRDLPLVTIDGEDARDFDDAVHATPARGGGWEITVAIADVAHYVRPGSALDREARLRGNSVYFPDRVVPMLPEALSNGLCSLRPREPRACLAFRLTIDADGQLTSHRLERGLMESVARLTYTQVQAARDGRPDAVTAPLLETVIAPLYGAYAALSSARGRRGTLEIDLPERQVKLATDGTVLEVTTRARFDSHRLIEEFMIAANVAAAETCERASFACLYRIHEPPDPERIEALRSFIAGLGFGLAKGAVRPAQLNRVLLEAAKTPYSHLISELVLRSQSQAVYSPDNRGHYGLALARYAHFTSPIRRYADLVVHRALIRLLGLGEGGLLDVEMAGLADTAEHISRTERRAADAEREAVDRFLAAWLAARVGRRFAARITGVTRFGLFVALDENGADGLIPVSTLPQDWYRHDEAGHALVGERHGRIYRLGTKVKVLVADADPITGSATFRLADEGADGPGAPETEPGAAFTVAGGGGRGGTTTDGPARAPGRPKRGKPTSKERRRTKREG